jgi:diguanylate cyclase (GGDEF)-like protein/putative nucleotidyltransferase with HDIG domain
MVTMRTRPGPALPPEGLPAQAQAGAASDALHRISRLLLTALDSEGPDTVRARLVAEVCEFLDTDRGVLLALAEQEGRVELVGAEPAGPLPEGSLAVGDLPAVKELIDGRVHFLQAVGSSAAALGRVLGSRLARSALILALRSRDQPGHALVLLDEREREFADEEIELASAFAAAAAAALDQLRLAEQHAAQMARQASLARAGKAVNESLDLTRVLARICEESANIVDADNACVYLGNPLEGLRVEAVYGHPPEVVGFRMAPGEGLAGKVVESDEPALTNDYAALANTPTVFDEVRGCLAVPMHWDGELRGVLSVGTTRSRFFTRAHLSLLEGFAELAAAACRNASAHAGLALAARTDALTGCLNHAALHDALTRELARCERSGSGVGLVLLDLDRFKAVNEEHGHLVGDEVLRRIGHALQSGMRAYDVVARYGGDEFAVVVTGADEARAGEVAGRALECVGGAVEELDERSGEVGATAGVAESAPGETATALIARADRALLFGKQQGQRGTVLYASNIPGTFRPGRFERQRPEPAARPPAAVWPGGGREQTERLRKRTRQLALANALGARLSAMTAPLEILEATVEELHQAFGFFICAAVRLRTDDYVEISAGRGEALGSLIDRRWAQPRAAGLIGRCLRERRPVVSGNVYAEADYRPTPETAEVLSELVMPVWVGNGLWGVIDVEEIRPHAFDEDDVRLVQTVADQLGSALRSAMLYERLDRAYMGTAEALAAALEAKDSYTASHSQAIANRTEAVGRRLGMLEPDLRTLRYGAIFHDIGKIAIPEAILEKRGPLTAKELELVERHTVVGERILSSVDFLRDVLPLVRHEHERWDGCGYPDHLAGEEIPLGARVILACDAFDAMTTDRPYRDAMSVREARDELRANAGTQFDPLVVGALLTVLDEPPGQSPVPGPQG